ncbi:hypothetical protein BDV33DRAFT_167386 [Aspergillus novoparasiticus]|uniref:Uncharacterized protein n=1 Tax=Aspergillus novoparasiticus TaxID=986946 RepID=A0A5N6F0P3_9EURO|nr:hypothetical protein BDV33DRAFT_167386 [Aspergillus novoparasiticus]
MLENMKIHWRMRGFVGMEVWRSDILPEKAWGTGLVGVHEVSGEFCLLLGYVGIVIMFYMRGFRFSE